MRKAALYSAGLHLLVIAFTLLGLPALFSSRFVAETAIVVEVVTMVEKPAAKPAAPPKPQPPQPPPQAPKVEFPPEPPAAAEPPPPPPPAAEKVPPPEPKAEPKPEPPKPIAKPEPTPPLKPTPPPEVAKAVPEPQRKPQPPKPDEFETLLKDLARERDARRPPPTPAPPRPQVAARSAIDEQRLAATIGQMVMSQIQRCWSIPSGVKDVEKTTVTVRISLSPDGSLAGSPVVESAQRLSEDPTFRTVAESALRALRNQRCMPLKLPYEHYDTWKYIALNFDPKELSQ